MLDIKLIREKTDEVKANLKKRNNPDYIAWVDQVIGLDKQIRELKGESDQLRARRNKVSAEINTAQKAGKDIKALVEEAKDIPRKIADNDAKMNDLEAKYRYFMLRIPNLLHESVPDGKTEEDNKVVKEFGKKTKHDFEPVSHVDLITTGDLADLDRAAKISGARWYFLKGKLARLQLAIMEYAVDFMTKKRYTMTIPPHFMSREAYEGVTDMDAFTEALYKVEGEELFAIATSEHPLTAQFMNEVMDKLPVKLFGLSPCYRKEAGAHGRDEKGIFRVHQFNKVEQIIVCRPENSWTFHEELVNNAIEFLKSLGIPFRQVALCSGDVGAVVAKTYDLEAWYPVQNAYKEVVSCSNVTDYQAHRLNIRFQDKGERGFVHTLNSTLTTDTRPMVAILENFQDKNGVITIPEPLQKYCGFKTIETQR